MHVVDLNTCQSQININMDTALAPISSSLMFEKCVRSGQTPNLESAVKSRQPRDT
jgi:hypothetical protein